MSAKVMSTGTVVPLDRKLEPAEQLDAAQVKDAERMARLLNKMLRVLAGLFNRWSPRFLDFEDTTVDATGTTKYRFPHGFKGRVRWWVVDWRGAVAGPQLVYDDETDNNTLVLVSYVVGTATVRIEEAG